LFYKEAAEKAGLVRMIQRQQRYSIRLEPLSKGADAKITSDCRFMRALVGVQGLLLTSGKHYFECKLNGWGWGYIGVVDEAFEWGASSNVAVRTLDLSNHVVDPLANHVLSCRIPNMHGALNFTKVLLSMQPATTHELMVPAGASKWGLQWGKCGPVCYDMESALSLAVLLM
jgi:hypothetical protein